VVSARARDTRISLRVGLGFDSHRFSTERPLVLGGVLIRESDGLHGHSDADVLTHAVMDALLGAAGLDDLGTLFPDTDPALTGADSLELLGRVVESLRARGYEPVNIDAVIICDEPRIAPHRAAMRARLAESIGIAAEEVNLKGKTTEGLGLAVRSEGIAVHAVALVEKVAQ
jgi:2-C-methyl-D-erythritol 2,4-cyclodiphosphate synthase